MNIAPQTYADALAFAQSAQCVSWSRQSPLTLSCIYDDMTAGRRTCMDLRIESGKCGIIEIRTLCGYDPVKHVWREQCSPRGTIPLADKRGLKALREWVTAQAVIETGYPNPISFSIYRK